MPISQVLIDGEDWQLVGEGYQFTEGPAVDRAGNVFFTDARDNKLYQINGRTNKVSLVDKNTRRISGLMIGPDGRLYGCCRGEKKIVAYEMNGTRHIIADVNDCNDLVVTSTGAVFYTDPGGGQVWYVAPDGKSRVVAKDLKPNGIILWPGEGTLVVTERDEPHLWTFRVESDGSLSYKERYYMPLFMPSGAERPGSDGMTVDKSNRLFVATYAGLQMFDPTGRLGGVIAKPQNAFLSNVTFGGPKFDTLYVTSKDKVFRRKTKTVGAPYFLRGEH